MNDAYSLYTVVKDHRSNRMISVPAFDPHRFLHENLCELIINVEFGSMLFDSTTKNHSIHQLSQKK